MQCLKAETLELPPDSNSQLPGWALPHFPTYKIKSTKTRLFSAPRLWVYFLCSNRTWCICIVSFNRKIYCYPHFIDVEMEAWICYPLWGIGIQRVRKREVARMAAGSSFAGREGWLALSKAGNFGRGQGKLQGVGMGERRGRTLSSWEARTLSYSPLYPQGTQPRACHETKLSWKNK